MNNFDYLLTDMADADFEYSDNVWDENFEHEYRVLVSKVGGGEVGRKYDGQWLIRIFNDHSECVMETGDLRTGTYQRHADVALIALDGFLATQ